MTHKSDSIELEISAYWNASVAQDEPLPPLSDGELARLIDDIQRSEKSEGPSAEFMNRLLGSIAESERLSQPPALPVTHTLVPTAPLPVSVQPIQRRRVVWLAVAALLVAIIGLSFALWPDTPEEPRSIPAALPTSETAQPVESRSQTKAIAQLSVDPDLLAPGARESWTAASFRLFEIPAGSFYQFPDCPDCAVLVMVTVTEGAMDLRVDGPIAVSNQFSGAVHQSTSGEPIPLAENKSAVFELHSVTDYRALTNDGDEPATLLVSYLYGEDFRIAVGGGTPPSLFSSIWTLPSLGDRPIKLGVDRLDIVPGGAVASMNSRAPVLYLLEEGVLTLPAGMNTATPISWTGPVGLQLDQLPAGDYELANAGPDASVLYRLTLAGTEASSDSSPTLDG